MGETKVATNRKRNSLCILTLTESFAMDHSAEKPNRSERVHRREHHNHPSGTAVVLGHERSEPGTCAGVFHCEHLPADRNDDHEVCDYVLRDTQLPRAKDAIRVRKRAAGAVTGGTKPCGTAKKVAGPVNSMKMLVRYRWNQGTTRLTSLETTCSVSELFDRLVVLEGEDDQNSSPDGWCTVIQTPVDSYESTHELNRFITIGTLPDHSIVEFFRASLPPPSRLSCSVM